MVEPNVIPVLVLAALENEDEFAMVSVKRRRTPVSLDPNAKILALPTERPVPSVRGTGAGLTDLFPGAEEACRGIKSELHGGANMTHFFRKLWSQEEGQDIAEYAVMLAVILVLVVGTIRLIGGSANNVFSATASSIGQ